MSGSARQKQTVTIQSLWAKKQPSMYQADIPERCLMLILDIGAE